MRLIILAAYLWFVTSYLHAKIVFTSGSDSNFMEVYTMNSDGKRDRIVVTTMDMDLLSVVAEAGGVYPPMVAIHSVSFGADAQYSLWEVTLARQAASVSASTLTI
ncbi:hypothetical protein F4X33_02850 [Candidatus Poribacteria bacterium]|nr:hypothetical protein [Candidatus Poribacteria bacterium]